MIRLLAFAALAIAIATGSAHAGALAEAQAPARLASLGGVGGAALAQPQANRAESVPARCPYHFGSDMPAATFCVYRGVASGGAGEVCATDVVVIWSSAASQAAVSVARAVTRAASDKEVYLGFVADPNLVVRAIVDPRQGDRAEIIGYTLGSEKAPKPLAGEMTLRALRLGSADVLSLDLRQPGGLHPGSCALASYSGTFLGVIRPSNETTTSIDAVPDARQ